MAVLSKAYFLLNCEFQRDFADRLAYHHQLLSWSVVKNMNRTCLCQSLAGPSTNAVTTPAYNTYLYRLALLEPEIYTVMEEVSY